MKNIYNIVDVRSLLFVFGIENAGDEISENKSPPIFLLAFRTRSDAMLMWPEFNLPFAPTLSYWLGGVSTFDREETLGAELRVFNPNDTNDREKIIRSYVLARFEGLTYRHRFCCSRFLKAFCRCPTLISLPSLKLITMRTSLLRGMKQR
jgi:hypothetical protein